MPYRQVEVPAERLIEYGAFEIYRTYDNNDIDSPRPTWYAISPDADDGNEDDQFDLERLLGWREREVVLSQVQYSGPFFHWLWSNHAWPVIKNAIDGGYLLAYIANRRDVFDRREETDTCPRCQGNPYDLGVSIANRQAVWCPSCRYVFRSATGVLRRRIARPAPNTVEQYTLLEDLKGG